MSHSRFGDFLNDSAKKNWQVLLVFVEEHCHPHACEPISRTQTCSKRFFYEKWRLVLSTVKMKALSLLIELFCSYATRKQLYNIFQPIVIDVKTIDVASHPIPR
jgi:hypothetical protein